MRKATIERKTKETKVRISLDLDGEGIYQIKTPIGFLTHMLEQFGKHSMLDLEINAEGDTWIDEHHTVEDIGIVLGQTIDKALGSKKGITRYGSMILPMDDVVVLVTLDLCGRYSFSMDNALIRERVGDLPTELVRHFFESIAQNASMNLHIKFLVPGSNDHHRIEAIFKAFGRALRQAITIDERLKDQLPTTKEVL